MDELKKFDIKVFAKTWNGVDPEAFMGVFQRWIQRHTVPGILVDVADYGHIHHGHGTVLVAHEYNLSIDFNGGKPGLMYRSKRPAEPALAARIAAGLRVTLEACRALEAEPEFAGKLAFDTTTFAFVANDRLSVPDGAAAKPVETAIAQASQSVYPGGPARLEPVQGDPRERVAYRVTPGGAYAPAKLATA